MALPPVITMAFATPGCRRGVLAHLLCFCANYKHLKCWFQIECNAGGKST